MSGEEKPIAGFNRSNPPRDGWGARIRQKYELPIDASLDVIEPVAKELWADKSTRPEAIELVLGRRVDKREIIENPELGSITFADDADHAFDGLALFKALEDVKAEGSQQ